MRASAAQGRARLPCVRPSADVPTRLEAPRTARDPVDPPFALDPGGWTLYAGFAGATRPAVLDPVLDFLPARTAPLGLLRRSTVDGIDFRYTEGGHVNGEDLEPTLRLWFSGARLAYPYGAPCYRVMSDAGQLRVTSTIGTLRRELGWAPAHTDFRSGLAQTIDWYSAHRDWWQPRKAEVEARYARTEEVLG